MPYPHNQGDGPKKAYKEIMGIRPGKTEGDKGFWSRIGVAWENKDGSWDLKFDYFPTKLESTTIQLRDPRPREGKATPTQAADREEF